jgi:Uma2 family endonuclease
MKLEKKKRHTYAELQEMDIEGHWELIDGIFYAMTAPSPEHQRISGNIFNQLYTALSVKHSDCEIFNAPLDVLFPEKLDWKDKEIDKVEPDILIVCDENKIKDKFIQGAPDFIVEILSPSNASWDCIIKRNLYEKNKVHEYWIIDTKLVTVLVLEEGVYKPRMYDRGDKIKLDKFDIEIELPK